MIKHRQFPLQINQQQRADTFEDKKLQSIFSFSNKSQIWGHSWHHIIANNRFTMPEEWKYLLMKILNQKSYLIFLLII